MKDSAKTFYEETKTMPPNANVQKIIELQITPGLAIDLGCGAGRDSIALLKQGWTVIRY